MHNRRSVDRARRRKVDEPEQEPTLGPRPQQPIRCLHCRKQTDPERPGKNNEPLSDLRNLPQAARAPKGRMLTRLVATKNMLP